VCLTQHVRGGVSEDGVNTALECFDFIISALERLKYESADTGMATAAEGLLKKTARIRVRHLCKHDKNCVSIPYLHFAILV